ncbi:hypothetical protein E3N88_08166 [Mikania micrantha]|uniref:Uncharacterized protein n=1 Tax=Mikania micrantha TaxID=192012 RepID=A0A5N6PHE4_9ASTR|nr:hypothetical protein E3N88_08166 [Mikania micrantha]
MHDSSSSSGSSPCAKVRDMHLGSPGKLRDMQVRSTKRIRPTGQVGFAHRQSVVGFWMVIVIPPSPTRTMTMMVVWLCLDDTHKAVLQMLPHIFVGKPDRLQKIINIVSDAAKQSLKKKGMPLPPW